VPNENPSVNRSQHYHDQAQSRQLPEHTEHHADAPGQLAAPRKIGKACAQADVLAARATGSLRSFQPLVMKTTPTMAGEAEGQRPRIERVEKTRPS
jgi:hypothetical protein